METYNPLLIVIDPGHGGEDTGAVWNQRLEKDDNLRLGLAVRDTLTGQDADVLMTRDTDVTMPLASRVRTANNSDADLFVSLHRNTTERPDSQYGVEIVIYLTAPNNTTGEAARRVLNAVNDVGVRANLGIRRGNHFVLRKTRMPAMMLQMGFIQNAEDNRLFDQNLNAYAEAIAKGILDYFGMTWKESQPPVTQPAPPVGIWLPPIGPPVRPVPPDATVPPIQPVPSIELVPPAEPSPPMEITLPTPPAPPMETAPLTVPELSIETPPPATPAPPADTIPPERPRRPTMQQVPPIWMIPPEQPARTDDTPPPATTASRAGAVPQEESPKSQLVKSGQQALNDSFGVGVPVNGQYDAGTKKVLVRTVQMELNSSRKAGIAIDGAFGSETGAALPALRLGDAGNLVLLLQITLTMAGYDMGGFGGMFDGKTRTAVQMFQRDNYLVPDGVAGNSVWMRLLG